MLLPLLLSAALAQPVLLQVELPALSVPVEGVSVRLRRLGDSELVRLVDDGSVSGDLPGDRVYTALHEGPYARLLTAELTVDLADRDPELLYAGTETLETDALVRLGWDVRLAPEGLVAARTAAVLPGAGAGPSASDPQSLSFGWGLVVMVWVGALAVLHLRR